MEVTVWVAVAVAVLISGDIQVNHSPPLKDEATCRQEIAEAKARLAGSDAIGAIGYGCAKVVVSDKGQVGRPKTYLDPNGTKGGGDSVVPGNRKMGQYL